MSVLPEPPTTTGQATNPLADSIIEAAVRDALHQTSYRDDTPLPQHGDAAPVWQDDKRIVPAWAAGLAIASIGVGAGSTGLGCAAWLLFKGLSMVSVPGLERFAWIIIAPFAGLAMAATAIGGLISKVKRAATPEIHNHNGPEYHETHVDQRKAVWQKNID